MKTNHNASRTRSSAQPFDLVLFGATGFTGTQTLLHLAQHVPADLHWAIGGRDESKLAALLETIPDCTNKPHIVVADSSDERSVQKLVGKTRVLIQLAGPYSMYGESFIRACAEAGVHYIDLSGEIPWVHRMIDRYHDAAQRNGARLIPVCGFEALPYDMAVLWAASQLVAQTGVRAQNVHIVTTMSGPRSIRPADMVSGGTTASIINMLAESQSELITDQAALVQDAQRAASVRAANSYNLSARYSAQHNAWLMPMVPAPFVNPPVIHRTGALLAGARAKAANPFAADFVYEEHLSAASFAPYKLAQAAIAQTMSRTFAAMQATATQTSKLASLKRSTASKLLATFGPKSGQGPREHMLEQMAYHMHITARSKDGQSWHGMGHGLGHPGYRSTANIVAQVGLLLATQLDALPDRAGVLTPASALGVSAPVLDALNLAGLSFRQMPQE